jgi:CRISPR-associated protein Csm2
MCPASHHAPPGRGPHRPPERAPGAESQSRPPILTKIAFGRIEPNLFSDIAEEAAKLVARANKDQNKPSQLRRFYDELVMLQDKVRSDAQKFHEQQPFIQMLKAKVAYARGREKVDDNFASLFRHVVDQSKDEDALKQARLFMEAFMAFYKVERPKD